MHLCCSNYTQIQGRLGSTLDSERTMGRMTQGVGSYFATQSGIDEVNYTYFARLLQCRLKLGAASIQRHHRFCCLPCISSCLYCSL